MTDEQRELAAIGSYAYWLATISDRPPTEEERTKFALREARRFVNGNPPEQAEKLCKEACQYRKVRTYKKCRVCLFLSGCAYRSARSVIALLFGILHALGSSDRFNSRVFHRRH